MRRSHALSLLALAALLAAGLAAATATAAAADEAEAARPEVTHKHATTELTWTRGPVARRIIWKRGSNKGNVDIRYRSGPLLRQVVYKKGRYVRVRWHRNRSVAYYYRGSAIHRMTRYRNGNTLTHYRNGNRVHAYRRGAMRKVLIRKNGSRTNYLRNGKVVQVKAAKNRAAAAKKARRAAAAKKARRAAAAKKARRAAAAKKARRAKRPAKKAGGPSVRKFAKGAYTRVVTHRDGRVVRYHRGGPVQTTTTYRRGSTSRFVRYRNGNTVRYHRNGVRDHRYRKGAYTRIVVRRNKHRTLWRRNGLVEQRYAKGTYTRVVTHRNGAVTRYRRSSPLNTDTTYRKGGYTRVLAYRNGRVVRYRRGTKVKTITTMKKGAVTKHVVYRNGNSLRHYRNGNRLHAYRAGKYKRVLVRRDGRRTLWLRNGKVVQRKGARAALGKRRPKRLSKQARKRNPFLKRGKGKNGRCSSANECKPACCGGYCCPGTCQKNAPYGMARCRNIKVVQRRPRYPRSCLEWQRKEGGRRRARSGRRLIEPRRGEVWTVYCDQKTAGGGWTSLLNPTTFLSPTAPGFSMHSRVVSGTSSARMPNCNARQGGAENTDKFTTFRASSRSPRFTAIWHYNCGSTTGRSNYLWRNVIGAKDVLVQATIQGRSSVAVAVNGRRLRTVRPFPRKEAGGCHRIASSPRGHRRATANQCWRSFQPASLTGMVVRNAIAKKRLLMLAVTAGAAGRPNSKYGAGWNIQRLMVR